MNELNEQMKNDLNDDYYVVTNLFDALREELKVCDDAIYQGLASSACEVFSATKRFVDVVCTDTYSDIETKIAYAVGFVQGVSIAFTISDNLKNVVTDVTEFTPFGCLWYIDTDERNEYMKRLANMLYEYVSGDNCDTYNDLFESWLIAEQNKKTL